MSMPVKVKSNYRSEMKNKLSETDDFDFEMNTAATRLLSATLSCSSTLSPTVPSLGSTYAKSSLATELAVSEDTGLVGSKTCKTNDLSSALAKSAIQSPATSSSKPYVSSAHNSYGEDTLNTLLTSLKVESSSCTSSSESSSSSSAHLACTKTIQTIQPNQGKDRQNDYCWSHQLNVERAKNDENSLNFDRGKEVPGDIAELADEAKDDGHEQLVPICQRSEPSGVSKPNGVNGADCASDERTARTSENDRSKLVLGCVHYKRKAKFVTPCCNKFYKCRYCHDENEDHHFDRKTLTELICSECDTRQRVQETCEKCGVRFGQYTCLICNLFDDEDKAQYHCYGCGICRIGGRKNFFHCEVCNMCLPIQLKIEGHRCVENISRSNCPVCLGDIHTSRIPCHIPDCGHLLHKECFDQLLASGHYVCPTCQTSIIDMTKMWEYLDAQILIMPVPKAYENRFVNIFCNDCHKPSTVKFHFIGLKCFYCGGYNTTQEAKRRRSWVTVNDNASSA